MSFQQLTADEKAKAIRSLFSHSFFSSIGEFTVLVDGPSGTYQDVFSCDSHRRTAELAIQQYEKELPADRGMSLLYVFGACADAGCRCQGANIVLAPFMAKGKLAESG